jgi:predicted cobalt transporter CbtA
VGSRPGHFFGFAFFTADFLAPFFGLLFESPAAPSRALRPLPMSALAPRSLAMCKRKGGG